MNFDDCLNPGPCALDIGDYTIRRNYYFHDFNTVRSSPNWNGNLQLHRQGVEWKHGSRDWVVGNIFDGPNGCDNQNPTGTAVLGKTPAGDVNDLNIEFNTVMHSCGFSGAGTYLFTLAIRELAVALSLIRRFLTVSAIADTPAAKVYRTRHCSIACGRVTRSVTT